MGKEQHEEQHIGEGSLTVGHSWGLDSSYHVQTNVSVTRGII